MNSWISRLIIVLLVLIVVLVVPLGVTNYTIAHTDAVVPFMDAIAIYVGVMLVCILAVGILIGLAVLVAATIYWIAIGIWDIDALEYAIDWLSAEKGWKK